MSIVTRVDLLESCHLTHIVSSYICVRYMRARARGPIGRDQKKNRDPDLGSRGKQSGTLVPARPVELLRSSVANMPEQPLRCSGIKFKRAYSSRSYLASFSIFSTSWHRRISSSFRSVSWSISSAFCSARRSCSDLIFATRSG